VASVTRASLSDLPRSVTWIPLGSKAPATKSLGEGQLLSAAETEDLHRDQNIRALRRAVGEAKAARPEILKVFLFGSLAQEKGKPDAGGELIVVVRKNFPDLFSRSPYQIFTRAVPTHSLVYSENEFEELQKDPSSFLAQNLATAVEL
jgi:hypothetical protein